MHADWFVEAGGDQFSEFGFMVNTLKGSLNDSEVRGTRYGGAPTSSFWYTLYDTVFFTAASMKTIDGGK